MNLVPHDDREGSMKVWLDRSEVDQLLSYVDDPRKRIALMLGARCGLRVSEIVDVRPVNVVETTAGPRVRVQQGKGDKYRETPAPRELVNAVRYRDGDPDEPIVGAKKRTVQHWIDQLGDELAETTNDDGWSYLSAHDLRRTWATLLSADEVNPMLVLDWGGWSDLETFMEHYRGTYSPAVQREELMKVDWLDHEHQSIEAKEPTMLLTD